ncbi:hypothetical protein ANN_08800 [Periplaneta americana]|uniref:Uncharacterized protein n=1 Tax=Periplaneta americana TaxID=6978 RepID=A0ABQ8T2G9_PERAM|nr:hypothetical protein ANN_08800 [Periplaneta americana]
MVQAPNYKVGVPLRYKELVQDEEFWPIVIVFRPFRAPWKYRGRRYENRQEYYNKGFQSRRYETNYKSAQLECRRTQRGNGINVRRLV